jgi:hypothetical protein
MFGIVDVGIPVHVFCIFYAKNDDSASIYLQKPKALFDKLVAASRPISLAEFKLCKTSRQKIIN